MILGEEDIGGSDDKVGTVGAISVGTGHGWAPLEPGPSGYVLTVSPGATTSPFDPHLPPVLVGLAWGPSAGGGMMVGNAVTGGSNNAVLVESGTGTLAALPIGSNTQVLTVVSGAPAWANAAVGMTVGNPVSGGTDYSVLCEDMNGNLQANGNLTFNGTDTILMQQTASSISVPSNIGFGTGYTGNMCQFQFDAYNCWRNPFGYAIQIVAYWGMWIYGNTQALSSSIPLASTAGGPPDQPSLGVVGTYVSAPVMIVQGAASQSGDLQQWTNSTPTVLTRVRADGSIALPTIADASAVNSSLYFSSTTSKLCYKDSSGGLHVTS